MSRSIRLIYLLLLGGSLLFAWFSVHQIKDTPSDNLSRLLLVGIAMLILAWVVTKAPQLLAAIDANFPQSKIARHLGPLIRALRDRPILYSAILVGGCAVLVTPYPAFRPWPVLALWTLGIVLFLVGAAELQVWSVSKNAVARVSAWVRDAKWELLAVLALTLLALLLRSIALDAIPHNVHGDEGEMGVLARAVVRNELRDPFATAFLGHATLWFFIQALALRIFGDDIGGLRMLSALLGTLAVPTLYIFARPLYSRAVATIATALLAVYHFHLHYSRIGLNNIADPLMMLLTLAAFFHGYCKRSLLGFALAGVFMGLAQYFYFSARFIPILVLAVLGYLALRDGRQLLEFRGQIVLMVIGFALATGPMLRYYIMRPDTFLARLTEHGLLQNGNLANIQVNGQSLFAALADHAYRTLGFFIAVDEHSPFYEAGIPLLDHGMEVLFILGLVLVLLNWQKVELIALLLWAGGTAFFGGFLLWGPPQSARYLIASPALCVLMALALVQIGSLLSQIVAMPQRACIGAIVLAALALMSWNIYFYFGVYTPRNSYAFTQATTEIANYLRPQKGERYVYMFTPPYYYLKHGTIRFVANDPEGIDVVDRLSSITAFPDPPAELQPLFIFVPKRLDELEMVEQRFPDGHLYEYRIQPDGDRPLIYIYEPRRQPSAAR